jgi:hypothetical protein
MSQDYGSWQGNGRQQPQGYRPPAVPDAFRDRAPAPQQAYAPEGQPQFTRQPQPFQPQQQPRCCSHRQERYRAGRCMDFEVEGQADIAAAIASGIGRKVEYLPVATAGAAHAAALIGGLL